MANLYVVVEELEQGSYNGVDNHLLLSAHLTEAGADVAVDAWRTRHARPRVDAPHVFHRVDENECWCSCGLGVHTEEVVLLQ